MRILAEDALEDARKGQALLVLSFTARWCSASHRMASTVDRIVEDSGRASVGLAKVDQEPTIPARFGMRGLPTTMLFMENAVASTRVGAMSARQVEDWVDDLVSPPVTGGRG